MADAFVQNVEDPEYESLMNDALFHMVFANNEKALRGLISSLLNIPEADMAEVVILNPMQYMDAKSSKLTVLDLRVHMADGGYVNIEMQVRRFENWTNRSVVYTCRQVTQQSNSEGFQYDTLEPVIQVAIMNHTLFEDHKRFFTRYLLQDDEGYPYSDKIQFYVMDLKAIDGATEQEKQQGLVEWAEAFTAKDWKQVQKINNSAIKEAVKQMRTIMNTPEQRQIVWDRRMAQLDHESMMASAERKGMAQGKLETLAGLIRKGRLTVAEAAEEANMSVAEFSKRAGLKTT